MINQSSPQYWRLIDVEVPNEDVIPEDVDRMVRTLTQGRDYIIHSEYSANRVNWKDVSVGTPILELHNGKITNLREHLQFYDDYDDRNQWRRNDWERDAVEGKLRWPNPQDKRTVTVNVTTWRELSLGATHFYAEVVEDDNQVWLDDAGDEPGWYSTARPYRGVVGRKYEKRTCSTEYEAQEYVRHILVKFFSPQTHKVEFRSKPFRLPKEFCEETPS